VGKVKKMNTLFKLSLVFGLLITIGILTAPTISAKEYFLKDYIPTNYAGIDQTANVQNLFDDVAEGGGGKINFDLPGNDNTPIKICGSLILWSSTEEFAPFGVVIDGKNSVIVTCEGQNQILINAGNLTHLYIKDLQVVSSQQFSIVSDALTIVRTGYVVRVVIDNVTFAGLTVNGKLVEVYFSDVVNITNSDFSGNATGFASIYVADSRLVSVSNSKFQDYISLKVKGNNWNYYSDTPFNSGSWIAANRVEILKTENLHFDEGSPIQVRVDNSVFANFTFTLFNVSSVTGGSGAFLNNVRQAVFDQSSTGLTTAANDLAVLKNGSKATVNYGFLRFNWTPPALTNAKYVSVDGTSSATLFESPQMVIRPTNGSHNSWYYLLDPDNPPFAPQAANNVISPEVLKSGKPLKLDVEKGLLKTAEKYKTEVAFRKEIEVRRAHILEKARQRK
jgi:hypothetical protein